MVNTVENIIDYLQKLRLKIDSIRYVRAENINTTDSGLKENV